jgi:hypothetical protein
VIEDDEGVAAIAFSEALYAGFLSELSGRK